jgi:hypothetical protein
MQGAMDYFLSRSDLRFQNLTVFLPSVSRNHIAKNAGLFQNLNLLNGRHYANLPWAFAESAAAAADLPRFQLEHPLEAKRRALGLQSERYCLDPLAARELAESQSEF